jgi:hypothetical protein
MENVWEYLRKKKLAVYNDCSHIVDKSCEAWNFFADDKARGQATPEFRLSIASKSPPPHNMLAARLTLTVEEGSVMQSSIIRLLIEGKTHHIRRMCAASNWFAVASTSIAMCLLLIIPQMASAANRYVDNSVASSGTGTSWSSAWKHLSNINWTKVHGGDTIYISGGSTSKTYFEQLTVQAGGEAGKPITITRGIDAGHNGTVIIDGKGAYPTGVFDSGYNYVVIQYLTSQNWGGSAFGVRYVSAGVILQYNYANVGNTGGSFSSYGYEIRGVTGTNGVIVQNNIAHTPANTTTDTDAVWTSTNNSVLVQNNLLYVENTNPNSHSDCWQSYLDTNVTFRNNYCSHPNGGYNNHGLWITDTATGGTIQVYNNIVYMPIGDEIAVSHWDHLEPAWQGKAQFWNNTIYGGYFCFQLFNSWSKIKNNICYTNVAHAGINIVGGPPSGYIDYNVWYTPRLPIAFYDYNTVTSWAQWQALGYDTHGVNADPKFTNPASQDFTLQPTSPAIDKGVR